MLIKIIQICIFIELKFFFKKIILSMIFKIKFILSGFYVLFSLLISGSVVLKKVKLNSTLEHENINNFKMLQGAFKKTGVDKVGVLLIH